MDIHDRKKEEKVRDTSFTNLSVNQIIHYTNILCDDNGFFKDNGVSDFSIIDNSNEAKFISTSNNDIYL